jgi:chromosome partitioning protein
LKVLQPPVRKSIRFAEAAQAGQSILSYAPSHPGAEAYRELGRQIDEGVDA